MLFIGIHTKYNFRILLPGTKVGIERDKRKSPNNRTLSLVRVTGVEPARISSPEPKSGASANFAIPAYSILTVDLDCRQEQYYKSNDVAQTKSNVSASFTTSAY